MKRILLLVSLVFFFGNSYASDVPTKLRKIIDSRYKGSSYITVFDSTRVDMTDLGLGYVNCHLLHKVLTVEGALKLKNVILDYDPLSSNVEILKISVWKKSGEEIKYSLDNIVDYPASSHLIYWGARQLFFDIGRLEIGDAVEIEYKRKGFTYALLGDDDSNYIPPMRGHFYDIIPFYSSVPIINKYYLLETSKSKSIKYEVYNAKDIKISIDSTINKYNYSFERFNITPYEREANMISLSDVGAKLIITTTKDWKEKSKWFYRVNEDNKSFESFPEMDKLVSNLIKDAKTEYDSIAILTHWVADNIRYCGVSMGKGEGYTLHDAKMNFHDRCGVCKDKAGMLISMLRSAGFESYPAMTMAGSKIEDIPADQFNHCVALVKVKSGFYKILDPTWVPFVRELWSSAEQQQNYLPGIPGGANLQITPVSSPDNHFIKLSVDSKIDVEGNIKGVIKLVAEGQSDSSFRSRYVNSRQSEWKNITERILLSSDSRMIIDSVKYDNPYNYSNPFELYVEFNIPSYSNVYGSEYIFHSLAMNLFKSKFSHLYLDSSIKTRKNGFKDRCSRLITISESIEFPQTVKIAYSPDSISYNSNSASVNAVYTTIDNKLNLDFRIKLEKRLYSREEWPDVRKVVLSHKEFINNPVILNYR